MTTTTRRRAAALMLLASATLMAAPAVAAAEPTAADGPIDITLEASPSCVRLGGTLDVTVGIKNTTLRRQKFYVVFEAKYNGVPLPIEIPVPIFGEPIESGEPVGPLFLPPKFGLTQTVPVELPLLVLPGRYSVEVTAGPSAADTTSYDAEVESVTVSPICLPLDASAAVGTAQ